MFSSRLQLIMTVLIAFCCVSCTDTDENDQAQTDSTPADTVVTDDVQSSKHKENMLVTLQVVDELPASGPSASFDIESTKVVEDSLQLKVGYGGGCKEHVFTAYWAPVWNEESPVSTEILISHDHNDDECEAQLRSTLTIDLTPLKEKARGAGSEDDRSEVTLTLVVNGQRVAHVPYRF